MTNHLKQNQTKTRADGKIRIIGGRWKRRVLPVANAQGLRPTGSRIRETLFNWLMPYLNQAHCLDLYSGTGALGLEALSRGAEFVHFVEMHKTTCQTLIKNLQTLDANTNEFDVHQGDALQFLATKLASNESKTAFDIVFLDPPFKEDLWQQSMDLIAASPAISSNALIYVERPRETKLKTPSGWHEHRSLNAGAINATLYSL